MKGNNFQLIVLIVCILAAVFGVFVFSGAIPVGNKTNTNGGQGTVVLWGTAPSTLMGGLLESFNTANPSFVVKYVQKAPENFDHDLLEALASGKGPDMFFLPDDLALSYNDKLFPIPYSSYPLSNFKNNFAGAGEVFLTSKGILAFPMTIDPLVMYYDRTDLDSNNIVEPPKTWNDLEALIPVLTRKDESGKLIKSTVGMGQFSNIAHAKDILSALFMQVGNTIVSEKNGSFTSHLGDDTNYNLGAVLSFYTDFADSLKSVYSWNKSLPNSTNAFSSLRLTFYFGFASELQSLVNKNPNQNFLVSPFPQIKGTNFKVTSARVTGIAVSSFSKNFNTAFTAANLMSSGTFAQRYAEALGVAPARRDLLKAVPADAYSPTFYSSALFARSWLDPSPTNTDQIFQGMIEKVLSNSLTPDGAIRDANAKMQLLLQR